MPRKDQLDPSSLRSRIRVWLATHPGWHDTTALAEGLGITESAARTDMQVIVSRLARNEDGVTRYRDPALPSRGPGTVYARGGTQPPVPTA